MLLIIGRLVHPGNERHLYRWAQHLSLNSLYRVIDLLYDHKTEIKAYLRTRENDLFSLNETIILYDLTNTCFEGRAASNPKAKRQNRTRSKRNASPAKMKSFCIARVI
ncbi:hypothetical protein BMS3Bbin03_01531 [bacterium BMS3Bbin03]|nr:hypothetical protein BMS3Bbin03_01531 [bacterium BMS3Bbin03]